MRRFLAVAMVCGAVTGAQAADMPDTPFLRGGITDGLTGRVNWQGVYVGGQVSYASVTSKIASGANTDLQSTVTPPGGITYNWQPLPTAHANGVGYGGFFGYNGQWDDVVLGVEANYIHDGLNSAAQSTGLIYQALAVQSTAQSNAVVKLSDFGSVRFRGGYVMGSFLPYAFVGTGFGSQTIDRSISASPAPQPIPPPTMAASKTKLVYGYSAGAGVDVMLTAGLFMRAEYEYRRVTSDVESNINAIRLGLGYKF